MSRIPPISDEEGPGNQAKLEAFYQDMLQAQMEKKTVQPIQEVEKSRNGPSDGEEGDMERQKRTPNDEYTPSRETSKTVAYSRQNLLARTLKKEAELNAPTLKKELNADDKEMIQRLQARDAEVRAHEMRHVAALGSSAGAVRFDYQIGPDGRAYAIGGSTEVRASGASDPATAAQRARRIRQAAMAGGDPSQADMSVAASATQSEQAAMARPS